MIKIKMMTSKGNNSTTPSGIDIFELPRILILRLKNARFVVNRSEFREIAPTNGTFSNSCEEGNRLVRLLTSPMIIELDMTFDLGRGRQDQDRSESI